MVASRCEAGGGCLTATGDLTSMAEATFTPCEEYPSDDSISFVVPADLVPDDYVVCVWKPEEPSGCGTFAV